MTAATNALQDWVADFALGGALLALEQIELEHGVTNEACYEAGRAISEALESLGITADHDRAEDIYRSEP